MSGVELRCANYRGGQHTLLVMARAVLVLCVFASWPRCAAGLDLLSMGVRVQVGEKRVLGEEQPDSFRENDLVASFGLPWAGASLSGWDVRGRLLASVGVLDGPNKNALVASAIPVLAFVMRDAQLVVDLGVGLALLSEHRYEQQDYGGPLQFALTLGVGVPVVQRFGVGYRFLHYSDAGVYGPDTIGADFHMVEMMYRY